jgi:hypothetical protein
MFPAFIKGCIAQFPNARITLCRRPPEVPADASGRLKLTTIRTQLVN